MKVYTVRVLSPPIYLINPIKPIDPIKPLYPIGMVL